jgi:outer membrane protein
LGTSLRVNLLNDGVFELGPSAYYRFGRDDDVEDRFVKKIHEVDGAFELGAFAGFILRNPENPRMAIGANVEYLQDLSDAHDGYTLQLTARGWYPVSRAIDLGIGAGGTYASNDYMSSFFGVTDRDAINSGLSFFDAGEGFRDIYFQPMMMVHFSEKWHLGVGARIKSLLSDAADSPIVDDRGSATQFIVGAGFGYAW